MHLPVKKNSIVGMAMQLYGFIKTCQGVHLKYVNFCGMQTLPR